MSNSYMTPCRLNKTVKNISLYFFVFVFLLANGYLFLIGTGAVVIAFGMFALLIYIMCFISGRFLISFFEKDQSFSKLIRMISSVSLALVAIIFTIVGQQNNLFDGMRNSLTVEGLSVFFSSYALGLSSAVALKMLINLWQSRNEEQRVAISNYSGNAVHKNSLIIGIISGVVLGIAWSYIFSPNFGFVIGIIFGTVSPALYLVTCNLNATYEKI